MEQRLIDANELKNNITKHSYIVRDRINSTGEGMFTVGIMQAIDEQPTIDAVPVIRCYECKYFTEFEKGFSSDWDGSCRYWNTHSTVYSNFCGCGARCGKDV